MFRATRSGTSPHEETTTALDSRAESPSGTTEGAGRDVHNGPAQTPEPVAVRRDSGRGFVLRRMLLAADLLAVSGALALSVWLFDPHSRMRDAAWGLLLLPGWILLFKLYGLYDRDEKRVSHSTVDDVPWLFHALLVGSLGAWLFFRETPLDTLIFIEGLAFFLLAFVGILVARSVAREVSRRASPPERVLLVGDGPVARLLMRKMRAHPEYALAPVGYLDDGGVCSDGLGREIPCLGRLRDLEPVCGRMGIERVVVAPTLEQEPLVDLVRRARMLRLRLTLVPDVMDVLGPAVEIDDVEGITVLGINPPALARSSRMLKRGMDLALGSAALILTLPFMAATALAVRLSSPGPALFAQERVGRNGRRFRLFKFRTMDVDAQARTDELRALSADPDWILLDHDPRVTSVGRWLRRTSLDELPQLWNVITGDMSLVGPRPLMLADHAQVSEWGLQRLDLTPGITGLWQVLGRTTIPFAEMVKLDYLYVTNWSLWNDVRLLIRTLPAVLRQRGAN
jgi:exopolysaccharide biosynthesis polyprenyl glycosylphosphotransferase